ncbi:hypothetical protein SAMN05216388_10982 [Halorientalis persicus]|uniref:Uncharacterized protein n=1 Tax=Halorientalis persicus TaxID=1367881 RepID=A0A1H8X1D1_9EURY|nr:hypothetical protein [Halorientalis persicus]SEP33477.1 hypothetical protein SAMN05216388_10982 [Halorientalis persicus]
MALSEQRLREKAANSEYTVDELDLLAESLERTLQSQLTEHFKQSRLKRGPDYWLLEDSHGVWLALSEYELQKMLKEAEVEFDSQKLLKIAFAHLESFQDMGYTIAVPMSVARYLEDSLFFAIYVRFPEEFQNGEYHTFQRFQELLYRYEMSPAEALDYWAVEHMNESARGWGAKRNVQPEAIRKNIRQAKEKLKDEELGATHENSVLRTASVDEIPPGKPHDPEKDLLYVPTEDYVEEHSEESI